MLNFTYHNPVKIIFGGHTLRELRKLIPQNKKILLTYGGGSIKKNGVYDKITKILKNYQVIEFGGIESNPQYETLMKAVALAKKEAVDFLLPVGGGSVLDGTKFIAAATKFKGEDPWDIIAKKAPVEEAIPLGAVITLPATGSEMNGYAVISRASTEEKLAFGSPLCYPQFSILDPESTFSLPERQVSNGIVDSFVHVMEQYMTVREGAPLQDRQAEAILMTLIEEAGKVKINPDDYTVRANLMWCACQALNGLIGCGVPQDWATHMIGHELTALYGLDHGQTLAVVLPAVLKHQKENKLDKLCHYAEKVWGVQKGTDREKADIAIEKTKDFFEVLGMKTSLSAYGISSEKFETIASRFDERNMFLGEKQNIGRKEVMEILKLCL
ncbi:MAG: iron-containing alcohol dehydrogenase [Proteobacteria bacterium]|nr:iron-containing alcohol dehydrogenase [Pseudomonadota bacterium]